VPLSVHPARNETCEKKFLSLRREHAVSFLSPARVAFENAANIKRRLGRTFSIIESRTVLSSRLADVDVKSVPW
jgi:hypothetical protein